MAPREASLPTHLEHVITEWKWIDTLTRQFELCNASAGQQVVLLTESSTPPALVSTARIALQRTGAPFTMVGVPSPRFQDSSTDCLRNEVVWAAVAQADLVIDCTSYGIDTSPLLDALLDANTRVLVVGSREPNGIERYVAHPGLEERVERGIALLKGASRLEITDPRGTKLRANLEGAATHGSWGSVTEEGTSDRWPSGFCGAVLAADTVDGIFVVMPGDINLSIQEFVHSPVTVAIDNDHISEIAGESGDADIIRTHLESLDSVAAYGISSIDIGMNHSSRRNRSSLYDRGLLTDEEARISAGSVTLTFGSNPVADRTAPGTFSVCLRHSDISIDGIAIVERGNLVGEFAPDVYETAAL